MKPSAAWAAAWLAAAPAAHAGPPPIAVPSSPDAPAPGRLPPLRPPPLQSTPPQSPPLPPPALVTMLPAIPPPHARRPIRPVALIPPDDAARAAKSLREDMLREVPGLQTPPPADVAEAAARARTMLDLSGIAVDEPQLVAVVDRNPSVQRLMLMLARPGAAAWRAIGAVRVSTGQSGRKDYYLTPLGVFPHTDAILDFRAVGTRNEHRVRGLGIAGMRVWDFGWTWAIKGWRQGNAGGDIRLQMHATDPDLLEPRLGHPASEGCVRLSSAMDRFLDLHGVLDRDVERAAITDPRYAALLSPQRTKSPIAGRLLIVIDTSRPRNEQPTVTSRPPGWPQPSAPPPLLAEASPARPDRS